MLQTIRKKYSERFDKAAQVTCFSPGRINLIGEHTDYNAGFVLPAAIDLGIYVAAGKRDDQLISMFSSAFDESATASLGSIIRSDTAWTNYILGIVCQLQNLHLPLTGFNIVVDGNLPIGAGMSSSAAVECAVIFALNELFELKLEKLTMVRLAQKAEHEFAGVKCGIMDMFASMFGKKDHAIKLDCRSLDFDYVPFNHPEYQLMLFNTNIKHNLAASAYNERRMECERVVSLIHAKKPYVSSLRDVNTAMLVKFVLPVDNTLYKRSNYVVQENERLLAACQDLTAGDLKSFGTKMFETHDGLATDYEVSCKELDALIDIVRDDRAVVGARMMGGGFGGCTLNFVKKSEIERVINQVSENYFLKTGFNCSHYKVGIGDGTLIL